MDAWFGSTTRRCLLAVSALVIAAQGLLVYRTSCPQADGDITQLWHWGAKRVNTALCSDYTTLFEYLLVEKWYWLAGVCAALVVSWVGVRARLMAGA